jgi:hypothetical protein
MEKIYEMEIGEKIVIEWTDVIRVPGGWIFGYGHNSPVFVPEEKDNKIADLLQEIVDSLHAIEERMEINVKE